MPKIRLVCQTITWKDERAEKCDYIVEQVAQAGYEGIEIGARFLDLDKAADFKAVLDRNNIRLIALHTGWNPDQPDGSESDRKAIDPVIDFALATGAPFIVMSMGGIEKPGRLPVAIEHLNSTGQRCKQHGLTFCYHNHHWEIQDDARVLIELEKQTDPECVAFCADIGWVRKTTPKFLDVLRIIESRIGTIHLKDYVSDGLDVVTDETEFGKGIVDFNAVFEFLNGLRLDELWVFAEQWQSSDGLEPEESIRIDYRFLKDLIG